jgi:hypothetical protein
VTLDAAAVRRLVGAYATHYDRGEFEELFDLFDPDARMVYGDRGTAEGLSAIVDRLATTTWVAGRRHVNAVSTVGPLDDAAGAGVGDVWAVTDWVMYRDREIASVGRYTDRIAGGRFVERRIRYEVPGGPIGPPPAGEEPPMTWPTSPLEAVLQTIGRYGQLADDRRIGEVADLFTEDGRLEVRGTAWTSRAEIAARGGNGPDPGQRTKHVTVNPLVDVADDGRSADVRTDFLYFVAPPEGPWRLSSTGRYVDVHVLDGDRWRIRSRTVPFDGPAPHWVRRSPPPPTPHWGCDFCRALWAGEVTQRVGWGGRVRWGQPRRTWPGRAPVCLPSRWRTVPFTTVAT